MHKTNSKGRGQGISTALARTVTGTATATAATTTSRDNNTANDDDDDRRQPIADYCFRSSSVQRKQQSTQVQQMPIVKMESFNFLNRTSDEIVDDVDDDDDDDPNSIFKFDFRMSGHGDEILSDFAALLNDAESELLASAVDNYESFQNSSTTATTTATVAVAAATTNRIESISFLTTENMATVCTPKPAEPTERLSQTSQSIGTIMSDHDYLSREDTLSILQSQDNQLLLQILKEEEDKLLEEEKLLANIELKPMDANAVAAISTAQPSTSSADIVHKENAKTATTNGAIAQSASTLTDITVMGNKPSKPIDKIAGADAPGPNQSVAFNLQTILSDVPGEPLKSDEMAQLIEELKKHTIQYAAKLRAEAACEMEPVQQPAASMEVASMEPAPPSAVIVSMPVTCARADSKGEQSSEMSLLANNSKERDAKNDKNMASEAMDTEPSFTFSRNHSEPLEYYGNLFDGSQLQSQETQETDAGMQISTKL